MIKTAIAKTIVSKAINS